MEKKYAAMPVEVATVSCMDKILPDGAPSALETRGVVLRGEKFAFQVAFKSAPYRSDFCRLEITGALADSVRVKRIDHAPAVLVPKAEADEYYLGGAGVYPDILRELCEGDIVLPQLTWRAFWVEVLPVENRKGGVYPIGLTLYNASGEILAETEYTLEVLEGVLCKTALKATNWLHYDCIANAHGVELFSDGFYEVFEKYLAAYVGGGHNMLFTPLFTPPLDTRVGGERKTAQLVGVELRNGEYAFDLTALKRFLEFAFTRGITYIEFSHLFTQWGGAACPKIMARVDGEERKIFGWDDDSCGEEYARFLEAFLPELVALIKEMGLEKRCYFHITDEPNLSQAERYGKCRALVKKHIGEMATMDALSDYAFYELELVDIAVPGTPSVKHFQDKGIDEFFAYYCCSPTNGYYSNRMLNMPSQRTRIIGAQLYLNGAKGFLHWGFNFYNSGLSCYALNPYGETDANGFFPAGDGFIVYPKEGGVNGSLRGEMMRLAFSDYAALETLEKKIGREKVVALLKAEGIEYFTEYPRDWKWHTEFRAKIDKMISEK